MGLSTAILTFLGGYLYEISPGLSFAAMLICTIPAIAILLLTRKNINIKLKAGENILTCFDYFG